MSKYDAERALAIYKTFSKQTNEVVEFLSMARQYEHATRLEIPKLKHAPTSLTSSLEEYLNDPDFEINRRQYLAQQEAKKGGKVTSNGAREPLDDYKKLNATSKGSSSQAFPGPKSSQSAPRQEPKGPAPDLIDFFESIEQNQQHMAAQLQHQISNAQSSPQFQYRQQTYVAQPTYSNFQSLPQQQANGSFDTSNPFGQMMPHQPVSAEFTGAGFGAYSQGSTVQPPSQQPQTFPSPLSGVPQAHSATFPLQQQPFAAQQQQSTNPFRQSIMTQATASSTPSFSESQLTSPINRQSTNPFARNLTSQQSGQVQNSPFASVPVQSPISMPSSSTSNFFATPLQSPPPSMQEPPIAAHPLQQARTGINPFARSAPQSQSHTPTMSPTPTNPTGSTNPFRQSAFVNQQTGQGWQASQGTMGGLEQLDTIPVFPRPGQQITQPQPQPQQQPWPR